IRLLADIRRVFEARDVEKLPTSELVQTLMDDPEAPWIEWRTANASRELAKLLRPLGVKSRTIRLPNGTLRGYLKEDFEEAWSRYLPHLRKSATSATTPQTAVDGPEDAHQSRNEGSSLGDTAVLEAPAQT